MRVFLLGMKLCSSSGTRTENVFYLSVQNDNSFLSIQISFRWKILCFEQFLFWGRVLCWKVIFWSEHQAASCFLSKCFESTQSGPELSARGSPSVLSFVSFHQRPAARRTSPEQNTSKWIEWKLSGFNEALTHTMWKLSFRFKGTNFCWLFYRRQFDPREFLFLLTFQQHTTADVHPDVLWSWFILLSTCCNPLYSNQQSVRVKTFCCRTHH